MSFLSEVLTEKSEELKGVPIYMADIGDIAKVLDDNPNFLKERSFTDMSLPHVNQVFCVQNTVSKQQMVFEVTDVSANENSDATLVINALVPRSVNSYKNIEITMRSDGGTGCKYDVVATEWDGTSPDLDDEMAKAMSKPYYTELTILDFLLSKKETITGISHKTMKTRPHLKGKKAYSSFPVTYISSRKSVKSNRSNSNIEWDFSWKVRGHWRYFTTNKIGRDRKGIKGEFGRTWISEYVKGNGELRETTRIITGK